MANESKIGAVFVEVLAKGIGAVQIGLNSVRDSLNKTAKNSVVADASTKAMTASAKEAGKAFNTLAEGVKKVGLYAQRAFLVGAGAIGAFISAADPVGFQRLQGTLGALSVQIGSIFIPILDQVQKALSSLLGWFRGLSNEQKSNILHWIEIAGAVLAVVAIVPKVIAGIQAASAAMEAFGVVLDVSTGGVALLIGAVAAAIPLLMGLFGAASSGGSLGGVFAPIIDALGKLWEVVQQVFKQIADVVQKVFESLIPIVSKIIDAVSQVLPPILDLVSHVLDALASGLMPVLDTLADAFTDIIGALTPVIDQIVSALVPVIEVIVRVLADLFEALKPLIPVVAEVIQTFVESLMPIIELIADMWSEELSVLAPLFVDLVQALEPVIKVFLAVLKPAIEALAEAIKFVIGGIRNAVNGFIDGINSIIDKIPGMKKLERIADPLESAEKRGEEAEKKAIERANKEKERQTPMAQQKPEILGVVDAWKKAQTASQAPQDSAEKERNELIKRQLETQQQMLDALNALKTAFGIKTGDFAK